MAATYVPIASITVNAATTSVTFSSIPSTYTDLVLVSIPLTQGNTFNSNIFLNNDSGSNYSYVRLYGSGTAVSSDKGNTSAQSLGGWGVGASTGTPIIFYTHIFDYANTTTYKSFLTRANEPGNSTGSTYTGLISSMWRSTAAVNEVRFSTNANFGSGSTFNLYGIKGANA
jgi:hypothetical protein